MCGSFSAMYVLALHWINMDNLTINAINLTNRAKRHVFKLPANSEPSGITLLDGYLYWAEKNNLSLYR